MSRSIPFLPLYAFMACSSVTFTVTFYIHRPRGLYVHLAVSAVLQVLIPIDPPLVPVSFCSLCHFFFHIEKEFRLKSKSNDR